MEELYKTYKNLLDKWSKASIIRVSKVDFELSDGSILPIVPPLEEELTVEKLFRKTLEAFRGC